MPSLFHPVGQTIPACRRERQRLGFNAFISLAIFFFLFSILFQEDIPRLGERLYFSEPVL